MMTNKYGKPCSKCGTFVAAGAGYLSGPPWKTWCKTCGAKIEAAEKAAIPMICIKMAGAQIVATVKARLSREYFDAYRDACAQANARYVSSLGGNVLSVEYLTSFVAAVKAAGLGVDLDSTVAAQISKKLEEKAVAAEETGAALAAIESKLAECGRKLFAFQKTGVEWLLAHRYGLLADEMGLGKTAQALCAIPDGAPVLIVAPVVAKGVWKAELKAWRPEFDQVTVLSGRGSFRWPDAGEVVITNYDILSDTVTDAPEGVVVIADEAHALKNKKAARTKRFAALSEAARKAANGRVWILTATPLLNSPPELWQVLEAAGLGEDVFGGFGPFCGCFEGHKDRYGYVWGAPRTAKLVSYLTKCMLRRRRVEVLPDLPRKMWQVVDVNGLDKQTKKICDEALAEVDAQELLFENLFKGEMPDFRKLSAARAALATAKIESMLALVEEYEDASEPLVVFSAHRAPIDMLATRDGWAVITGDTSTDERAEIQRRFQAGELKGVGATIKAGGVAITLTAAHHALFVDLDWTPALNAQAEDRICRIGQTQGVVIKRLVAEHALDQRITALLSEKQALIDASVEAASAASDADVSVAGLLNADDVTKAKAALAEMQALAETSKAKEAEAAKAIEEAMRPDPAQVAEARKAAKAAAKAALKEREEKSGVERHAAASEVELWVADGLQTLAGSDDDYARFQNGIGFNKPDSYRGHELAALLDVLGGLSTAEWREASEMLAKYHGQIGKRPTAA